MDSAKGQLIERLKTARSVLITVSQDPSVDQLAACIALTLIVNKLGGHGSAVFSGQVPSTIEFLKPEETLEKTADSLRDFIIALDKNKADKLRYKVEDQVVRIFITPYRTSLSEADLEFSQGDFNVELLVALGVKKQEDLDQAIVAHGRILHDATVACINTGEQGNLGSINWQEATASSLCELIADLVGALDEKLLDEQIATCLLTGVIAETDRFSNEKTTSQTMSVSAGLMAAGANQQLVATNLSEPLVPPVEEVPAPSGTPEDQPPPEEEPAAVVNVDGTLNIEHEDLPSNNPVETPNTDNEAQNDVPSLSFDENPDDMNQSNGQEKADTELGPPPDILPAPVIKDVQAVYPSKPVVDSTPPASVPLLTPPPADWTPPPVPELPPQDEPKPPVDQVSGEKTLSQLEKDVDSPHQLQAVDEAREKVEALVTDSGPDQAIGSMPLGGPLHENDKPKEEPKKDQISLGNTGLDPSLFSEVPLNKPAPPVPPPIPFPLDSPIGSDDPTSIAL